METTLHEVDIEDKPLLRHLVELYRYDFSEFDEADLNEHGVYGYRYLDHYWTDPGRHPLIIRTDGRLAGFAFVNGPPPGGLTHTLAEFFVLRKYRRRGVGHSAASLVFGRFPGMWQLRVLDRNVPAKAFWSSVVNACADDVPEILRLPNWEGPVYQFSSTSTQGLDGLE